ncbi:guanylate kinase [Anaerobacterium chartisolvens]|uniref:Guanylate kinase n=2 Tax=Anaerobacterium chartisolvens TaxID=1297424 RepID=A0A369BBP1_9FIRM|nr:guanylate kinase [Anaerobacterium chartisolvens]
MSHKGLLVILCGPSGVGKGTILNKAMHKNKNIRLSVSATTRSPRSGEEEAVNYYFKSIRDFKKMIEKDELVEWVEYCGNYYGTPKRHIEDLLGQGYDVVLEIEVEGAARIKNKYPEVVSVFVLPPTFEELRTRLAGRGTEDSEVIEKRIERARQEIEHADKYDYIIINDDIDEAADKLNCILQAEKLTVERNKHILEEIGF